MGVPSGRDRKKGIPINFTNETTNHSLYDPSSHYAKALGRWLQRSPGYQCHGYAAAVSLPDVRAGTLRLSKWKGSPRSMWV